MICDTCLGEGFIDLGETACTCADCNGTGEAAGHAPRVVTLQASLTPAEAEMLRAAIGSLYATRPMNRRLGRPATAREIVSLALKLGLSFGDRHREPQTQWPRQGTADHQEELPGPARGTASLAAAETRPATQS